ncbi:SBBP repeat-containing protein [Microscilla marina]|uniref:Cell surface protein, putative n=1 Tax=Microscilla marina ATCC 23134 TaxID=313606 RepID=A1ZK61_MICM2|nr:SBBP repeat-containing protein [Microscilla marina]EAY29087.1 cell surface protein, putative [Microscilla marina ATCC 23134]
MKVPSLRPHKFLKQIQKILLLLCWVGICSIQAQNYEWAHGIGGTDFDAANDVAVDASGNVYVVGNFRSTNVDFNPSAGNTANLTADVIDVFIAKYTKNGDYLWAHKIGGANTDDGLNIAVDANGNVYITGAFSGTVDFDPSAGGVANLNDGDGTGFFAKYDTNGNYVWAHNIGTSSKGIAVDASNNVYVIGDFFGTLDFDPSTTNTANLTASSIDIFFAKYDTDGNYMWAHKIGGSGFDFKNGNSIVVDGSGNVYITGNFRGANVDFDPSAGSTANLSSNGDADAFFAKYDSNGNYLWAHKIGGTAYDGGVVITVDGSSNVYIIGAFTSSNVDFDPSAGGTANLSSNGNLDIFFAKYDSNGNYVWAHSIGGTNKDSGRGMTVDGSGNVYITGYFQGFDVDFDPSAGGTALLSANRSTSSSIYVAKYNSNGEYIWAYEIGGDDSNNGAGIVLDGQENIVFTGYFSEDNADFDPSAGGTTPLSNQGQYDIFIAKYCQSAPSGAGSITSSATTVCQSQTGVTYTVPAIANATGYTWTLPAGASIVAGANTNSITVDFSDAAVSGNVTVSGTNACGNGTTSTAVVVTVNPLPASAGSITSSVTTVCQNQTGVTYTVPAIANATGYTWTLPTGANIVVGANTNSITVDFTAASSGNVTVKGTNACGDGAISAALAVAISTSIAPAVSLTSDTNNNEIVQSTKVTFTATPSNTGTAPTYQWQIDGANIAGATNDTYVTSTLKNGETVSVIVTASEPCVTTPTASASLSMKVVSLPDQPFNLTGVSTLNEVVLSWQTTGTGNEAGFHILRSIDDSSNFVNIVTLGADIRTYTDIGQSPNTQLYYKVVAFNIAGETESAIFSFLLTGTNEELTNVYPNPFSNTFSVTLGPLFQDKVNVRLLNLQGQLIKDFGLLDTDALSQKLFDASTISSGIYILELVTNKHRVTVRVFKK